VYTKTLYAGWGDMDFNSHMANTAYLDKAADVRQKFLAEHGFPIEEFARQRIGPVVRKDEIEYFAEVGLQQDSLERTTDFVELPTSLKPRESP
jgi:acyl-CoA thioester hydrolase